MLLDEPTLIIDKDGWDIYTWGLDPKTYSGTPEEYPCIAIRYYADGHPTDPYEHHIFIYPELAFQLVDVATK